MSIIAELNRRQESRLPLLKVTTGTLSWSTMSLDKRARCMARIFLRFGPSLRSSCKSIAILLQICDGPLNRCLRKLCANRQFLGTPSDCSLLDQPSLHIHKSVAVDHFFLRLVWACFVIDQAWVLGYGSDNRLVILVNDCLVGDVPFIVVKGERLIRKSTTIFLCLRYLQQ
jgi:hypothetical protein